MLSKNTTRGARHGQPELNAARLRNAQQVGEGDERGGRGRCEREGRAGAAAVGAKRALRAAYKLMIYEII